MPLRLLVRARNSQSFPEPGSYAKGDIVVVMPAGHVWGGMEGLPDFVQVDITNTNTESISWLEIDGDEEGNVISRRKVRVDPVRVDEIIAQGGQASFNLGQFNSRVVTRQL